MVITMASYALQTPPRVAHAKPPGPIQKYIVYNRKSPSYIARKWSGGLFRDQQKITKIIFQSELSGASSFAFCFSNSSWIPGFSVFSHIYIPPEDLYQKIEYNLFTTSKEPRKWIFGIQLYFNPTRRFIDIHQLSGDLLHVLWPISSRILILAALSSSKCNFVCQSGAECQLPGERFN